MAQPVVSRGMDRQLASYHLTLSQDIGEDGRRWTQVFPWGEVRPVDGRGPWYLGEAEAVAVRASWDVANKDKLVDYEHASEAGYFWSDPPPMATRAAGWAVELAIYQAGGAKPDGLPDNAEPGAYLLIEWSKPAAEMIRGGEYRYISAVFWVNDEGHILSIEGAGLTNTPAIPNMLPVAAKEKGGKGADMSWKEHAKTLGIEADTEEKYIAELTKLKARAEAATTPPPLPAQPAPTGPTDAEKAATERAEAAEKELAAIKAAALIDAAIGVGKLTAATRDDDIADAASSPERYSYWEGRIAKLVARTTEGQPLPPQGRQGATAADKREVKDAPSLVLTGAAARIRTTDEQIEAAQKVLAGLKGKLNTPEAAQQIRAARLAQAVGG